MLTAPTVSRPTVALGVLPSVVYRISAPAVPLVIVTLADGEYVPGPGLNTGAVTKFAATVFAAFIVTLCGVPDRSNSR